MTAGTHAGFIAKDYTPRMKRLAGVLALMSAFAAYGCMSSTLVLHVMPDGSGRAVITARVFEPAARAFDTLLQETPTEAPKLEALLPEPSEGQLRQDFGASVRLVSTKLDKLIGEIFLEYEAPQAPPQPPRAPAVQAPPDTEIYLAPMKTANGAIEIGPAVDITNNPGYDNQPFFTPDGKAILFTSVRGSGTQTDIYKYDIAAKTTAQVTNTPESEYSPTITPAGKLSVIRVELDAGKTQRLWQFTADGRDPQPVLETIRPVGYHAWADHQTLALFVLGATTGPAAVAPATLQLADTRTGTAVVLASDVGRSIQRIPGSDPVSAISFVQRERRGDTVNLVIKQLNPSTRQISTLTSAVAGSTEADCAWTPDGALLMAHGGVLYGWRRGQSGWKEVMSLERLSLRGVTRIAVSPQGDYLALVGLPRQSR
jgi:hypothetical protein